MYLYAKTFTMEILISYDNQQPKNTPEHSCISKRLQMDEFDEILFNKLCSDMKLTIMTQLSLAPFTA